MNISYNISITELNFRKFLSLNFYFDVKEKNQIACDCSD